MLPIFQNTYIGTAIHISFAYLGCPSDCGGAHKDFACCSEKCPCLQGEGDCDFDSHCKAGLFCHDSLDNCGAEFPEGFDCCAPITTTTTTTTTPTTTTTAKTTTTTTTMTTTTTISMFIRILNTIFLHKQGGRKQIFYWGKGGDSK